MNMTFEIWKREPLGFNYSLIHSMRLKTGTYKEYADYISIAGQDLTFSSLVKSVGKTKYDIPVSELDTKNWAYQHNEVFVNGSWIIPEESSTDILPNSDDVDPPASFSMSLMLNDGKMPFGGVENDFKSQEYTVLHNVLDNNPDDDQVYFFMSGEDDQNVLVSIDFSATYVFDYTTPTFTRTVNVELVRVTDGSATPIDEDIQAFYDNDNDGIINIDYRVQNLNIALSKGDKLRIQINPRFDITVDQKDSFTVTKYNRFDLSYIDKLKLVSNTAVVTPLTLANALLDRMSNGDPAKKYVAAIDNDIDNPWAFNHYLVAAESIRGFEKANFHLNFNDFIEYMQFLGYEYEADDLERVINFRKRAYFFNPDITALELSENEVANMEMSANEEYADSTVRVGYEKPDIENTNGRFAICGAFDYSTDYSNLGDVRDSSIEILCPYKADPVEIETLSWTQGEKTTDQKADNDIFMLAGEFSGDNVVESRQAQYVVKDIDIGNQVSWYNVPYIPYFIAKRNADKIGVGVRNLIFTGTDTYREATLSGVVADGIYSNISIADGLFLPVIYEFEAGTHKGLPSKHLRSGLVRFMWQGRQYQGYINELIKNDCAEQRETWILYGK